MADKLHLEIVTPDRQLFRGQVDRVEIPGREGYMGILPGHAPLLSELKIGVITYVQDGKAEKIFCGWGFTEVLSDQVSILTEIAETEEEIDVEEARQEKEQAQKVLQSRSTPDVDYGEVLERLNMATSRLDVVSEA